MRSGFLTFSLGAVFVLTASIAVDQTCSAQSGGPSAADPPKLTKQRRLQEQLDQLKKRLDELQTKYSQLEEAQKQSKKITQQLQTRTMEQIFQAKTQPAAPPQGTVPQPYNVAVPNVQSDIPCGPRLSLYTPKVPWPDPEVTKEPSDPTLERPAKYAYVSDPAAIGQNIFAPTRDETFYCNPLRPITRLLFENAAVAFNEGYTNVAGFTNVAANVPITQSVGNTFQVGVGYSQKPILKQIRSLFFEDPKEPYSVRNQGTLAEDLLFNAITLNAGISYGKTLTIKNNTAAIESLNSRPSYYISGTWSLDIEKLWIHLAHPESRTANSGYYFGAPCQSFWTGQVCNSAPSGVNDVPQPPRLF